MGVALVAKQPVVATPLTNFHDTPLVRLTLGYGDWVVLGRVVFRNADGDPQDATAQLVATTAAGAVGVTLDDIRVRVPDGGGMQCVELQATYEARNRTSRVEMNCATYKGTASDGSLIAMQVDEVVP